MAYEAIRKHTDHIVTDAELRKHVELRRLYAQLSRLEEIRIESGFGRYEFGIKGSQAMEVMNVLHGVRPAEERLIKRDIDISVFHPKPLKDEMDLSKKGNILEFAEAIQAALPGYNLAENIETRKFSSGDSFQNTIRTFLNTRDMSRTEFLLSLENGRMVVDYTEEGLRDLLSGTVMFGTGSPSISRLNYGLIVPLPLSLVRGFRSFIENNAQRMFLTEEQIRILKESARDPLTGKTYGPISAAYAIPLFGERYEGIPLYQKRLMTILNTLGLTDENNFNEYRSTLETEFIEKTGTGYELNERTIAEVFTARSRSETLLCKKREQRNQMRKECQHEWHTEMLTGVDEGYMWKYCSKCNKFHLYNFTNLKRAVSENDMQKNLDSRITRPENLPSNDILIRCDLEQIPDSAFIYRKNIFPEMIAPSAI
jgi:hypothetical protein